MDTVVNCLKLYYYIKRGTLKCKLLMRNKEVNVQKQIAKLTKEIMVKCHNP